MRINFYTYGNIPTNKNLQVRYLNGVLKLSVSLKLNFDIKYWDTKKQRFKSGWKNSIDANLLLNRIQTEIEQLHFELILKNMQMTKKDIENIVFPAKKIEITQPNLITFLNEYIEITKPMRLKSTIGKYILLVKDFELLEEKSNKKIYLETLTHSDLDLLMNIYIEKELSNQTIMKKIKLVVTFLNYCINRGLEFDIKIKSYKPQFKNVKHKKDCLTFEQLKELLSFKIEESQQFKQRQGIYTNDKYGILEKVRDIFCFACLTGLRVSDINNYSANELKDGFLTIVMKKTKEQLRIKLPNEAIDILKKYDYDLPQIASQNINEYIKKVCEQIGWSTPTRKIKMVGPNEIVIEKPFYEFVTIHMARRTFITLSMTHFGISPIIVQAMVGHQKIETTMGYTSVKQADMDNAMAKWQI